MDSICLTNVNVYLGT